MSDQEAESMIPASSITFSDDGSEAWLICPNEIEHDSDPDWLRLAFWHGANRPCDTCGGTGTWRALFADTHGTCPYCDGTGRHLFEVVMVYGDLANEYPLRVSVKPGMVLPITDVWATTSPAIYHDPTSPVSEWWWCHATPDGWNTPITLPPDARPGMWAVRLHVHQGAS